MRLLLLQFYLCFVFNVLTTVFKTHIKLGWGPLEICKILNKNCVMCNFLEIHFTDNLLHSYLSILETKQKCHG